MFISVCGVSTLAPAHAVMQLVSCPGFFRDGMGCDPKLDMDRAWEGLQEANYGVPLAPRFGIHTNL